MKERTSKKLEELQTEDRRLRKLVSDIDLEMTKENLKLIKDEWGVEVGSIVRDDKLGECKVFEVRSLSNWGRPWVYANPRRKDGSWSKNKRTLYGDWELVT